MPIHRFSYIVAAGLALGMASPAFSEDGVILLAQVGSNIQQTMTREQAIAKATTIKRGNVLKATLEKRENKVVWEVKVDDGSNKVTAIQIDPKSKEIIKSVDIVGGK
ncbi:MAG: hypothetical protein CAF41_001675 [Nitrospira sp. CG24A]|nr:MAG: hypothetical protein CAF41_001675 [Nitrospira sp. CG24A]